jgi:predicted transposase YbfD/YdcC
LYFYNGRYALSKKTLEVVKETNNEAVIQVKANQMTLYCLSIIISAQNDCVDSFYEKPTKVHGRIESRKVEVFEVPEYLKSKDNIWKHISCIIKVNRCRQVLHSKKKDDKNLQNTIHYYISTKTFDAKTFNDIIRGHWKIENSNHYVKDVALKEDSSRIRKNPNIFARLRSLSLNIFRNNKVSNVKFERYANSLNLDFALNYVGII